MFDDETNLFQKDPVELVRQQINNLRTDNANLNYEIKQLNEAIQLLKDYIVSNGLKPFWQPMLDPKSLTKQELIERNSQIEIRRPASPDAIPQPSIEELQAIYDAQGTNAAVAMIMDLMGKNKSE